MTLQAQTFTTFAVNPQGGAVPTALNDSGEVVGSYGCEPRGCGFSRDPTGKMHHLGKVVTPLAVNDSGEFVGYYNGGISAFYSLPDGQLVKFLRGDDPLAIGVNNAGYVAGSYCTSCNLHKQESFAFLIDPSGAISNIFSAYYIFTRGINNLNQVVGSWANGTQPMGFLYSPKTGVNDKLNFPGAVATNPSAINDNSEVTGSWTDSEGIVHGFYWTQATGFTSFDAPKTTDTLPFAINASGTIVGYFYANSSGTLQSGFMLDASGTLTVINVPNSISTQAYGVNSQGLIVGAYVAGAAGKQTKGFLYQPAK